MKVVRPSCLTQHAKPQARQEVPHILPLDLYVRTDTIYVMVDRKKVKLLVVIVH
ncbi:hypothetical protein [Dipodfec virus RodF1_64]|uniref:Uncharacterized protein n=1 Tax=Dipodfec virus RodF1_64 TaxID=2929306 RepID=A0A976N2N9_9VIRU|nr:hypothetical protein [Dipodfec virus RodF1_64]